MIVGFKLTKLLIKLLKKSKGFQKIDSGAQTFIASFLSIVLKVILVLTAVALLGVPMTNLVAIVGSCGLAVGLALQGSLSNLAGGLMIMIFKPFQVGDEIEFKTYYGVVESITILYTNIRGFEHSLITIPNASISNGEVINHSVKEQRRLAVEIGVAYESSVPEVMRILCAYAKRHEKTLTDPPVSAHVKSYDDSAITIELWAWTRKEDYWATLFDLRNGVREELAAHNIAIPFPQMDVHITPPEKADAGQPS